MTFLLPHSWVSDILGWLTCHHYTPTISLSIVVNLWIYIYTVYTGSVSLLSNLDSIDNPSMEIHLSSLRSYAKEVSKSSKYFPHKTDYPIIPWVFTIPVNIFCSGGEVHVILYAFIIYN